MKMPKPPATRELSITAIVMLPASLKLLRPNQAKKPSGTKNTAPAATIPTTTPALIQRAMLASTNPAMNICSGTVAIMSTELETKAAVANTAVAFAIETGAADFCWVQGLFPQKKKKWGAAGKW